jgi:fumarate hydratase class II
MIIFNLLNSSGLLGDSCRMFTRYCVAGLEANEQHIQAFVDNSLMLVTALNPVLGYDKAAEIAKKAHKEGTTLKQACLALAYLTAAEFDQYVNPKNMIAPRG